MGAQMRTDNLLQFFNPRVRGRHAFYIYIVRIMCDAHTSAVKMERKKGKVLSEDE